MLFNLDSGQAGSQAYATKAFQTSSAPTVGGGTSP